MQLGKSILKAAWTRAAPNRQFLQPSARDPAAKAVLLELVMPPEPRELLMAEWQARMRRHFMLRTLEEIEKKERERRGEW